MKKNTKSTTKSSVTTTKTIVREVKATKTRAPATAERLVEVFERGALGDMASPLARLIALYLLTTGQNLETVSVNAVAVAIGSWPWKVKPVLKNLHDSRTLAELLK